MDLHLSKPQSMLLLLDRNIIQTTFYIWSSHMSLTRLSDFTLTFHFHALEKEMATHSIVLAWRIPGDGGAWWAAVCGVAQSRTRLK